MTRFVRGRLPAAVVGSALLATALLAACGGGGGDSDTPARPAVTLSPITTPADMVAGMSAALTVTATVNDTSVFNGQSAVYAYVVDDKAVIQSSVQFSASNATTYIATLSTNPNLKAGHYTGTLQVKLCKDSACASQYPGSPMTLPYDFIVNPAPFGVTLNQSDTVTVYQGGKARPIGATSFTSVSQPITGSWNATSDSAWLTVSPASGTGNFVANLDVDAASLAVGKYSGTVTVKTEDGRIGRKTITVQVLPTSFSFSTLNGATFTAINGTSIPSQTIKVDLGNNAGSAWEATSSESWLKLSPVSGNAPTIVTLAPDAATSRLASGTYTARAAFSAPALAASASVPVTLTLVPATFKSSQASLLLGGATGRTAGAATTTLSLNTDQINWPFTISGLPSWLTASSSGQVNGAGTPVTLNFDAAAAPFGSTTTGVQITSKVNGDTHTLTVPVVVKNDERRLVPQRAGIGLASTPMGSVLSRTIRVAPSFGDAVPWSAVSDAPWLSVSTFNDRLTVSVNGLSLPMNAISYANVTLSSTTPRVAPATVRVAVWRGNTAATAQSIPGAYQRLVADPIRPWVYAHKFGNTVDVIHVHTGAIVNTVTVGSTALDGMAVSPDGGRLYLQDPIGKRFLVLRLPDFAQVGVIPQRRVDEVPKYLAVGRPAGIEVLYAGTDAYRVSDTELDGVALGELAIEPLTASLDGNYLASLSQGQGKTLPIEYTVASNGGALVASAPAKLLSTSTQDLAFSLDGTLLYAASRTATRCDVLSNNGVRPPISFLDGGSASPNNVEVGSNGRIVCGVSGGTTYDFWVNETGGSVRQGYKVAGASKSLLARQLVISADGGVVVTATDDPKLAIVPIGY